MFVEFGHYALVLAMLVALVQSIVPMIGAARGHARWMAMAGPVALAQFALIAIAFAVLTYSYIVSDFSVLNVASNSHSDKPLFFKISGVWGNHEGSLLLWALLLAMFGFATVLFGRNLPHRLLARVMSVQGMIGFGFLAFILFTSNPFLRLFPAPIQGNGLNPLLQDYGLALHPPTLYAGYVGFSVVFAFAIAALLEGKVDAAWARFVRPWVLVAWGFLTLGNGIGSWWAYYELGWGGWWFWDPVENSSFMPWLVGTALLHSIIVVEKRETLKSWTVLLAIMTFSLSLMGMFLVRSGVLTSVHAFASDPGRGVFILVLLLVTVGGSLGLFAWRAPALKMGSPFAPISREGSLLLNNCLFSIATAAVMLGTLYPLFLDVIAAQKISVGPPFFNSVFLPIMIPMVVVMAVGPFLRWKRSDLAGIVGRLQVMFFITVGVVLFTWGVMTGGSIPVALGLGLAAWLFVGTLVEFGDRIKLFRTGFVDSLRRARRLPRAAYGMTIAHAGVAVLVAGISGASGWQGEKIQMMGINDTVALAGYDFTLTGVSTVKGPNYTASRANFLVARDGVEVMRLNPERRTYVDKERPTTEAAIRTLGLNDLYVVIGEVNDTGRWVTRIYYRPLVSLLWAGVLIMALGAVVSLGDRRSRVGIPARLATRRRNPKGAAPAAQV
ncbi:MAG: heme lyase CcmF/NrfE family subunit [Hyphomicrobiales bacterium]